jgi:hypothetical protein
MRAQSSAHGALFTIDFTDSSDSDPPPEPAPPLPAPADPDPSPPLAPVKVVAQTIHLTPRLGTSSDDEPPAPARPAPPVSPDVFVLEDDDPPRPPAAAPAPAPGPPAPAAALRSVLTSAAGPPFYALTRAKKKHLNGESIFFTIEQKRTKVFTAKFKKSRVSIFAGARTPRLSETPDAVMLVNRDLTDFSFRQNAVSKELLTVRFTPPSNPVENARKMVVNFFTSVEEVPSGKLTSRNPKLLPDGSVTHDFDGRFAIISVKNAVLVATSDGPPLLLIRKAGKDVLEIEVRFGHEAMWIFAIGIASFLTKVTGSTRAK